MELKKNPKADVQSRKSTNLLIGLNAALLLILGLFFVSNAPEAKVIKKKSFSNEEMEIIPPTEQEPPKAPPPPPSPEITEVEDEADVEETEMQSTETNEKKVVITTPVPTGDDGGGDDIIKIDNTVYTDVDVEGTFPGGEDKLTQFVQNFYKMPAAAQELGISGIIFIQFVVERDGSISNIKAIAPKARQLGYGLEKECMRVIKLTSGKWKPAERAGKKVRSYWRFPFEIDNSGF